MKLPWTAAREEEARAWSQRWFGRAAPASAARVAKVLFECLDGPLDELQPDGLLSEHEGYTELQRVELILALEQEFGLTIPDDQAELMNTPASIVSYVAAHPGAEQDVTAK